MRKIISLFTVAAILCCFCLVGFADDEFTVQENREIDEQTSPSEPSEETASLNEEKILAMGEDNDLSEVAKELQPSSENDEFTEDAEATEAAEVRQAEPSYTLHIPSSLPIAYRCDTCSIGTVSVTDVAGYSGGDSICIAIYYDGVFQSLSSDAQIPYSIFAENEYGDLEFLNSGDSISFLVAEDGEVPEYGSLLGEENHVVNLVVSFPEDAWDALSSGSYSTEIQFVDSDHRT